MAKTTSNSLKIEVWGSDRVAQGADALVDPSQSTIEKGFIDGIANANDFTWVPNVLGGKINHCLQNGVPLWNSTTAYVAGNMVTHSSRAWQCLVGNTNSTPADGNANWDKVLTVAQEPVLPNGYLNAPVPTYDSAQPKKVNFNGALTARTQDNTANIILSSASRNLDLATSGANGLADGLTVANNTWYYVYAYSGGLVASTTNGASTLTIGTVSQKVVQLPLTLRTDGSSNILPFRLTSWQGRLGKIKYQTTYDFSASPATGTTRVVSAFANTSYTSVDFSSFAPPSARVVDFAVKGASGIGQPIWGYREASGFGAVETILDTGASSQVTEIWDNMPVTSSQTGEFKIESGNMAIFATGYTINL